MLNELAENLHEIAVNHGWWGEDKKPSFGEVIALCHSELSEALEEYRANRPLFWYQRDGAMISTDADEWDGEKPEGTAVELIDCIIRVLDYLASENIDVDKLMNIKATYNATRPYRHGNKKL